MVDETPRTGLVPRLDPETGRFSERFLPNLDAVTAADISNPETATSGAVSQLVENAFDGFILTNVPREFFIGNNTGIARPVWSGPVWWMTTVNTRPVSMLPGDTWRYVEATPLPDVVVASDNFTRADGPAGSTPVGNLPWLSFTAGTGRLLEIASNAARFTTGSSSAAYSVLESGAADFILEVAFGSMGPQHYGGIVFRLGSLTDQFVFAQRTGVADFRYRMVRRVANAAVTVLQTEVQSADNDVVRIEGKGSQITIFVNGTQIYTGVHPELASNTKHGLYSGNTGDNVSTFKSARISAPAVG